MADVIHSHNVWRSVPPWHCCGAGRAAISSAYTVFETEAFKPPQPKDNEHRLGGLQK